MDSQNLKNDFPILARSVNDKPLVYLDNAATSHKPKSVIDAISQYYTNTNANVHRGIHTLGDESTSAYQNAREVVAKFIHAKHPHELVFVKNTTEAINLVAHSWALKHVEEGDEIIVTELEHHSNLLTWQRVCKAKKAHLIHAPLTPLGHISLDYLVSIAGKNVKLIAITHVSNTLGTIIDIQHLVSKLKKAGYKGKVLLDAAQSVPHMPVRVYDLGIDFMAFSGHKMCGPMGIGGLWAKKDLLSDMDPFLLGGGMISEVHQTDARWAELPDRFDAGTPNVAGAVGLAAACEYLGEIGMQNIFEHEQELVSYGIQNLLQLKEEGVVDFYGTTEARHRAGVLTFNINGVHAHDVAQVLDREFGIAIRSGHHCNQILNDKLGVPATCRASMYLYNTKDDIDLLVEGIRYCYQKFNTSQ